MMKKNFRNALIYIVKEHYNDKSPVGDFCRDSLDYQYLEEMEDPCRFFNFILDIPCCDGAVDAMKNIIRMYNKIIDKEDFKIYKDYKESKDYGSLRWSYKWEIDAFDRKKYSINEAAKYMETILNYIEKHPKKYFCNTLKSKIR